MAQLGWTIVGFLFGIVGSRLFEILSRPSLSVRVGSTSDGRDFRFLHLEVENCRRKGLLRFLRSNRVADYVKVNIKILDPDTSSLICEYIGRWSSRAEPVELVDSGGGRFNPALAIEAEREILLPGEKKQLTVAIKHKGEEWFHGFNNWSYPYSKWQNPDWCVDRKSAILQAEVHTGHSMYICNFALQNPSKNLKNFHLAPIVKNISK